MVLNAAAWLSPFAGGSGLSNGNTQGSAVGWPAASVAGVGVLASGRAPSPAGGGPCSGVPVPSGRSPRSGAPSGQPALGRRADGEDTRVAPPPGTPGRRAERSGAAAVSSPFSSGWIGRYVPGCGHQAQKRAVRTTALSVAAAIRLRTDPRLQRASPRNHRSPMRPDDQEARHHGQHHSQHLEHLGGGVDESPVPPRGRHAAGVLLHRGPGRTEQSRHGSHQRQEHERHHRDRDQHPRGDHRAGPRLQDPVARDRNHRCGSSPSRVGLIRW